MPFLLLLLSVCLLVSCDRVGSNGVPAADPDDAMEERSAATYERRFLFLATEPEPPLALVYDFIVEAERTGLERTVRGWLGRNGGWASIVDEAWEMEWVREPWRLLPSGPLRLIVGEGDNVEAIVYRGEEEEARLAFGTVLNAWSPHPGGQLRIQRAQLRVGEDAYIGTLLDTHFVYELLAELTPANSPMGGTTEEADGMNGADATPAGAVDAPAHAAGRALTFDQVFVTDGRETFLVASSSDETVPFVWLYDGGVEETWEGVDLVWLEPREAEGDVADAAAEVPTGWRLETTPASLQGEFHSLGHELTLLPGDPGVPELRGLYVIRGWIELHGERRQVAGIVVHGQG